MLNRPHKTLNQGLRHVFEIGRGASHQERVRWHHLKCKSPQVWPTLSERSQNPCITNKEWNFPELWGYSHDVFRIELDTHTHTPSLGSGKWRPCTLPADRHKTNMPSCCGQHRTIQHESRGRKSEAILFVEVSHTEFIILEFSQPH